MAFKHSAFVAIMTVPVLCSFAGGALAEEQSSAKAWAAPNVAGMPGYKEPPKVDEIRAPIPVKDNPRYGGHYLVPRAGASEASR